MILRREYKGDKKKAEQILPTAKRFLGIMKNNMRFQGLKQLSWRQYLPGGVEIIVRSIFGQDSVEIFAPVVAVAKKKEEEVVEPEKYLVLLIASESSYAVWKVEKIKVGDETVTSLTSYSYQPDFEEEFVFADGIATQYHGPSTVKNNGAFTRNKLWIQNDSPWINYYRYAVDFGTFPSNYMYGLRNDYQPSGWEWSSGEMLYFDYGLSYKSHPDTLASPPAYVCSSRHPWGVEVDGSVFKNLELWYETTPGYFTDRLTARWETADGIQKQRMTSDLGGNLKYTDNIHAIITKEKFIGRRDTLVSSDSISHDYYPYLVCDYPSPSEWAGPWGPEEISGTRVTDSKEYRFGDVVLDFVGGSVEFVDNWVESVTPETCGFVYDGECIYAERVKVRRNLTTKVNDEIYLLDYDNQDGDETFICFWQSLGWESRAVGGWLKYSAVVGFSGFEPMRCSGGFSTTGDHYNTYMGYRIKGGALQKFDLGYYGYLHWTDSVQDFVYKAGCPGHPDVVDNRYDPVYVENSSGSDTFGTRVLDVTCQIIPDLYMIYSYKLEDHPIGGSWEFTKRVLGIIDINTGVRTEYEVDNDFLGSYSSTFDKTQPAAIGLHKMVKEV